MHILTSSWRDGYLDYPLIEGHVRIHVLWWADLARLGGSVRNQAQESSNVPQLSHLGGTALPVPKSKVSLGRTRS